MNKEQAALKRAVRGARSALDALTLTEQQIILASVKATA